jgi:hypothetical protein
MNAEENAEIWRSNVIQSILHSGTFGITIYALIIASILLAILCACRGWRDIARAIMPLPAISGVALYAFVIWRSIPERLHAPGVGDPNWYFYMTSDAGFIMFSGCVASVAILALNLTRDLIKQK